MELTINEAKAVGLMPKTRASFQFPTANSAVTYMGSS